MFDCCDTKLLQELARQTWKNRLVYLILAESRLIAFEATSKISIVTQSRPFWSVEPSSSRLNEIWRTRSAGSSRTLGSLLAEQK